MNLLSRNTTNACLLLVAMGIGVAVFAGCSGAASTQAEIVMKATEWRFEPASVQITAGEPVRLVLKNEGKIPHDVAVLGLGAEMHDQMMAAGSSADQHGAPAAEGEGRHMAMADHDVMADHDAAGAMVHTNADPGSAGAIEFTPTAPGRYQFICTIPGHKEAGMVGEMVVVQGLGAR
mgnify:CR=1 FL=1